MCCTEGRLTHDADSHLMELDDCLDEFITQALPRRFHACAGYRAGLQRKLWPDRSRQSHADPAFRFSTFCLGNLGLDQGEDMALCYAAADAHNRMLADF